MIWHLSELVTIKTVYLAKRWKKVKSSSMSARWLLMVLHCSMTLTQWVSRDHHLAQLQRRYLAAL